jgi:hypothetical protein
LPKLVIDATTNPLNPAQCLAKLASGLLGLPLGGADFSPKLARCRALLSTELA